MGQTRSTTKLRGNNRAAGFRWSHQCNRVGSVPTGPQRSSVTPQSRYIQITTAFQAMTVFPPSCKQGAATWAKLNRLLKAKVRARMSIDRSMHASDMAKNLEHLHDTSCRRHCHFFGLRNELRAGSERASNAREALCVSKARLCRRVGVAGSLDQSTCSLPLTVKGCSVYGHIWCVCVCACTYVCASQ